MTDFNIKYAELSLTGLIPVHPHYLYEYEIPDDLEEVQKLIYYTEDRVKPSYITYTNKEGNKVIATNVTPVVLKYKPIKAI